jgi:hypothetical protein
MINNIWFLHKNSEDEVYKEISPCSTFSDLVQIIKDASSENTIPVKIVYQRGQRKVLIQESSFQSFYNFSQTSGDLDLFITFETNKSCDLHNNKVLEAFCLDCNSLICIECLSLSHIQHQWKPWDKYVSSIKNSTNSFQIRGNLNEKNSNLTRLIDEFVQFKEKLKNDFETFNVIFNDISTKINNKITNLNDVSQSTYNEKERDYVEKLKNLNELQDHIKSIMGKLDERTEDFIYLRAVSDANEILKKNYSEYDKKEEWKLSIDTTKLEEYLNSITLQELNYYHDYTEFIIDDIDNISFKQSFVLKVFTKNIDSLPCAKGVTSVKVMNITENKFYELRLCPEKKIFTCEITPKKLGTIFLYPFVNNIIVINKEIKIKIKSHVSIENTRVTGWEEGYNYKYNSPFSIMIKTFDKDDYPVTHGFEKFKVTVRSETNLEMFYETFSDDLGNGNYKVSGNLIYLGKIKISIYREEYHQQGEEDNKVFKEIPGSPFEIETKDYLDLSRPKNLSVHQDYVPDWKLWEGIRELMQNWRDGIIENLNITINQADYRNYEDDNSVKYEVSFQNQIRGHVTYDKVNKMLYLKNKGVIPRSCLALGKSNKLNDPNAAGHFGEGMKLAALSLVRLKKLVSISTASEKWTFSIQEDEFSNENLLHVKIDTRDSNSNETEVAISNIQAEEFSFIISKLRFLEKRPKMTASGEILVNEKGAIYVKGIYVCENKSLIFGYDLQTQLKLDRDRKLIADHNELYQSIASIAIENIIGSDLDEVYKSFNSEKYESILRYDFRNISSHSKYKEAANALYSKFISFNGEQTTPYTDDNPNSDYYKALAEKGVRPVKVYHEFQRFLSSATQYKGYWDVYHEYIIRMAGVWYKELETPQLNMFNSVCASVSSISGISDYYKYKKFKCHTKTSKFKSYLVYNKNKDIVIPEEYFESEKKLREKLFNIFPKINHFNCNSCSEYIHDYSRYG